MKILENSKAYLAWISVSIVWGTTYLAIRIGVKDSPPMLFAGLRWMIAGTLFFGVLKSRGVKLPPKKQLFHIAVPGIFLIGIANGLVVVAEQWIPSGLAALILTTTTFFLFCMETSLPQGPKFNGTVLLGLVFGFIGVFMIFYHEINFIFSGSNFTGLLLILLATFSWSFGTVYSKYKKAEGNLLIIASLQMIIAGAGQTVIGLVLGEYNKFHFTYNSFLAFLYLIFIASLFGYACFIYAIAKLPISFVSTYAYINPLIALFLGWLLLGEELNIQILFSAAIIIAGVFLVKKGSNISKSEV
jgi:drug/metabolite transporter (DMT)-like permease